MRDEVRAVFGRTLSALLREPKTFGMSVSRTGVPTRKTYTYAVWLCYLACRENPVDWEVAVVLLANYGVKLNLTALQIHHLRQWEQYIKEVTVDQQELPKDLVASC